MARSPRRRTGVSGDREIIENLRRLQMSVGGRQLDTMSREALEPMKERTEQNAKRHRQPQTKNGQHLDQSVRIAKHEARGRNYREYWIAFAGRGRRIAHLVEFGTRPHAQPIRGIMHPGARAFPFFRPAFEATKEESGTIFARLLWQSMVRSLRGRP